ncbi:MAG: class I SAM-dependent methyltransferase [Pseudomonadota bacterium]
MSTGDVISPIDFRLMEDAQDWTRQAMQKRPWRTEFFEQFAEELSLLSSPEQRVLELGSGPGFLAEVLLQKLPDITYTLLDFSKAMHQLAKSRLKLFAGRIEFIERSFKEPDWPQNLGQFQGIVTNQAVHELRHKRYALALHTRAHTCLAPGGVYLVCDHFVGEGGMTNEQLYMTIDEQKQVLLDAGFDKIEQVMLKGGLVMHKAV